MSAGLRSGELAAAAGVNVQTLRYYERRGLLAEPDRTLGGHRVYPAETVTVLRVIKAASGSDSPRRLATGERPPPHGASRDGCGRAARRGRGEESWPTAFIRKLAGGPGGGCTN